MSQTTFGVIMLTALLVVCLSMAAWPIGPTSSASLRSLTIGTARTDLKPLRVRGFFIRGGLTTATGLFILCTVSC